VLHLSRKKLRNHGTIERPMMLGLPVYTLKNVQECSVYSGYKTVFMYFVLFNYAFKFFDHTASVTCDTMVP
jgi:hypothetical protein